MADQTHWIIKPQTIKVWTPPSITVGQLKSWMKHHKLTHRDLASAIGMPVATLRSLIYSGEDVVVPLHTRLQLAAASVFSGLPGLFKIKVVNITVAQYIARGLNAANTPKTLRTIAQTNSLGYAIRLAEMILQVGEVTEPIPNAEKPELPTDETSGKENTDAHPQVQAESERVLPRGD